MTGQREELEAALSHRYEVLSELGSGGMACVYLANDRKHERQVALKVLRPEVAASIGNARFLREVRLTARLQHPHILPLFDSGEADGALYYVMPYIRGETLAERLKREGRLPNPEAARILTTVVEAVGAAHRQGVLHRDIKPGNVLLSDQNAFVSDFGVARAIWDAGGGGQLTTAGVSLGTAAYMAPEQATGEAVDHRADVYSLGVLAYESLAGRLPFESTGTRQLLLAHAVRDPEPLHEHRPDLREDVADAVMKCLAKDPDERWQRVDDLLPALKSLEAQSGRPSSPGFAGTGSGHRSGRSQRWVWATLALVGVAAGVLWLSADRDIGTDQADVSATPPERPGALREPPRVAILPLENRTGDPSLAGLGRLIQESAIRRLTQAVPALDVASARTFDAASTPGPSDADLVVRGSFTRDGERLRAEAEIVDTSLDQIVEVLEPTFGPADASDEFVGSAAEVIAAATGFEARHHEAGVARTGIVPPQTLRGLALFSRGEDAFCRGEWSQALETFEEAIRWEPSFSFAYERALMAHANGGRATLGRDSLLTLLEQRGGPRGADQQLILDQLFRPPSEQLVQNYDRYVRVGGTSWFEVAFSALQANYIGLAHEAVSGLDEEFGPWGGRTVGVCRQDFLISWGMTAAVYHLVGDYERERAEVAQGRARLEGAPGYHWLVASAARAEAALGNTTAATSMVDTLLHLPSNPGLLLEWAVRVGEELETHGHPAAARSVYEATWAWSQDRDLADVSRARIAYRALPPEEALPILEAGCRQCPNDAPTLGPLALTLDKLERAGETEILLDSVIRVAPRSGWPAWFHARRGDAIRAVSELRRTIDAGGVYYNNNYLGLHRMPELLAIVEDPAFRAFVRAKVLTR